MLERLERSGVQGDLGPILNEEQDPQVWIDEPGSPVAELADEPEGRDRQLRRADQELADQLTV